MILSMGNFKNIYGRQSFSIALVTLCLLVIPSCSYFGDDDEEIKPKPVAELIKKDPVLEAEKLFNEASDALDAKRFAEASGLYEELERQYPYSKWATQSQLMAAYATYKIPDYNQAIIALDRFLELHPGHERIDYAYYLKALSHYDQISDVKRDQSRTAIALRALELVIRRFPDTEYARDARFKRDLTFNHLAGKEMDVGRYYLRQKQVHAAINRFRNVVKHYQTTTHAPEALHRLVEAYTIIGLRGEARKIAAILGHNYPGSKWYEYSYRLFDEEELRRLSEEKSWIDLTVGSLFSDGEDKEPSKDYDENKIDGTE